MIHGHLKAIVIKPDGRKIIHCDAHNTIHANWLYYFAGLLTADANQSLDDLFTVYGAASETKDGIILQHTDDAYYQMKCTGAAEFGYTPGWSEPTTKSSMLTGIFTGSAITISGITKVQVGYGWEMPDFGAILATPSAWASLALAADDVLVIQWTITLQDA